MRLGAIVSANSYYPVGFADKFSQWGLGPERADSMVRAASVVARGIPFSLHSDLPMCPGDPLLMASFAVNRVTSSGRVAGPEQRIDVDTAMRAVTIEAAYSWRRENELGSIEVGKIANLTSLDESPYDVDPSRIGHIPIRSTMFQGRLFHIDPMLVDQRIELHNAKSNHKSFLYSDVQHDSGCGCEVAVFLGEHINTYGWVA
jgi:predicted amidohydrolase YtcJ